MMVTAIMMKININPCLPGSGGPVGYNSLRRGTGQSYCLTWYRNVPIHWIVVQTWLLIASQPNKCMLVSYWKSEAMLDQYIVLDCDCIIKYLHNKANLRDLIAATGLLILLNLDSKSLIFQPVWPWNLMDVFFYITSSFVHHFKPLGELNWSYCPETLNSGQNRQFFVQCDFAIWWMTLKNKRAPLLRYSKLCVSFQSHRWIQTGVTVRKRSTWVKIGDFVSRVTLKFEGWPCKRIWHLCYVASSFAHHFIAIGEFKLKLQSRNAQFG